MEKTIKIDVEQGGTPYFLTVYANYCLMNFENEEVIATDKKSQIIKRIDGVLNFLGINHEII